MIKKFRFLEVQPPQKRRFGIIAPGDEIAGDEFVLGMTLLEMSL